MLGDTAVAVHPDHPRMAGLIGKQAILPLVGRRIPIVGDTYADPEKGTGAVKITPAHDFNDFAVGQRHKLPMPSVLTGRRGHAGEIEDELAAIPGVAEPAFVRALAGRRGSPPAAPSSPNWNAWNCWSRSIRTRTRCRTATAAACRWSR